MRAAHSLGPRVNLDLFRSFFAIVEHGSLNRAAERLRVSQSTLTRQMHALEHEVGGPLLERSPTGVALTATGHVLLEGMRTAVAKVDAVLAEARTMARGQSLHLRIGYLQSAAAKYLHPALAALRRSHPEVKVKLLDLSPGEQITALRRGELDLAIIGSAGAFLTKEFYVRRLATLPVLVALPEQHPLAGATSVRLADLRKEHFIGAPEADMPGYNRWIVQVCRRVGFRPRFIEEAPSFTHGLATVVTEGAVSLLAEYARQALAPGVVFVPVRDAHVKWDFLVAWQRGRIGEPVRAMLEHLPAQKRE